MGFERPESMQAFGQAIVNAGDKKCFVQVSATWCGPCQLIKDQMEQLSSDMADSYAFVYVDVDKCDQV